MSGREGSVAWTEQFTDRAGRRARVMKMGTCLYCFGMRHVQNSRIFFLFSTAFFFFSPAWFFPLDVEVSSVQELSVENHK